MSRALPITDNLKYVEQWLALTLRFFCPVHGESKDEEERQELWDRPVSRRLPRVVLVRIPMRTHIFTSTGSSNSRPRWSVLPPEVTRMILQYLKTDTETLRACSRTAHEFRHVALSYIGRHLTLNSVERLKEGAQLIKGGAFQHIRSLDLGVNNKKKILEAYWNDYIVILRSFARSHTLNRLWLSEVPFIFLEQNQKENFRNTVTALGSTVTELGLYGCHFSSYKEMVSFIRSFPLCNFLFVRDCVTGEGVTDENAFAGLPEHKLAITDLQLSSSSSNDLLIDVSNLIEDAELDVRSLASLVCDFSTSEGAQRVAAAVCASPVEHFQVACAQPGGFQGP